MVYEKLGEDEELTNEDFYSDDFHKAYTKSHQLIAMVVTT